MAVDVTAFAESFRLTGVTDGTTIIGGSVLDLSLVTDMPIGDSVVTEVVNGEVDLDLLFRHVKLPDLESTVPNGPWPRPAGLSPLPGVEEVEAWAGTVKGSVPVGFREIEDPVRIDYRWHFTNDQGNELPSGDYAIASGSLSAANVSPAFKPEVTAWTADVGGVEGLPATRNVCIQAEVRVRLEVTGADSGWIAIPPKPICIGLAPLPIPEVAAVFRNQGFEGDALLLMVPENSPFAEASEVVAVIQDVFGVVRNLERVGGVAAWALGLSGLVSSLTALAARVPAVRHLGWQKRNSHWDLGKYNFIAVDWQPWDDDMEDRASSAVAVSPVRRISFFQHDDYDGKRLTIDARPTQLAGGLGAAAIPDLHAAEPAAVPPGAVNTSGSPGGGWGDAISSYRWEDEPVVP